MQHVKRIIGRVWRIPVVQFTLFFVFVLASRSAIADWNYVPSGSMKPTLVEGDLVWVNRLAYDLKVPFTTWHVATWDDPRRGDVVVAYSPEDDDRIIKRVVAVPGDTLQIVGQTLLVNGQRPRFDNLPPEAISALPLDEIQRHGFARETLLGHSRPVMYGQLVPPASWAGPLVLDADEFFLMGDHRNNSHDSRYYGPVTRDRILGRATHVIGSLDIRDRWQPRWDRFFANMQG